MIGRCADPSGMSLDCKGVFQLMDPLKFVTQMVASHISAIAHFTRLYVISFSQILWLKYLPQI